MNRTFDFYEYAGLIIPGAALVLGLSVLIPELRLLFGKEGVTLGEFGLFVVVTYAAGHLVQGIGNWIEWLWWKCFGGLPSIRALSGKTLSADQYKRVLAGLREDGNVTDDLSNCTSSERLAIIREMYSVVAGSGKAARIDIFNGNYSLLRGLAAAFLVLLVAAIILAKGVLTAVILGALFVLALQRMHRFAKYYALELLVQYLLVTSRRAA
jgi:hypothetical protein